MTDAALEYWEGSEPSSGSFCPEAALFRFLGSLGTQLHGSRVLEVGCGANRGVSLSECRRRGAEAFGTDLSEDLLSSARSADPELHLSRSRAGVEPLPFDGVTFDVMFVIDVLYYLSDEEIRPSSSMPGNDSPKTECLSSNSSRPTSAASSSVLHVRDLT